MRWEGNRLSLALVSVGTLLMVAAVTLWVMLGVGVIGDSDDGYSQLDTITTFGKPIELATGPTPTPSDAFPPGSNAPITRLVIPDAEVDAPVVVKGVDNDRVMQSPDNAYDTAWYDFSAHPGFGGNAVFSGHVDYIDVGPAVFWNLKDLEAGDVIEVHLEDSTVYRYGVVSRELYDAATAPVDQIVGPTEVETVTLITCGGTFNPATHQYDKRTVIRAERLPGDEVPAVTGITP